MVTNITPNHLDYHTGYDEYIDAKRNLIAYQRNEDITVLNLDNNVTNGFVKEVKGKVRTFSRKDSSATIYFDGTDIYVEENLFFPQKTFQFPEFII